MSDELFVVTVTYSPGPHLGRFLATLAHATERPVTVIMADNGSTDGSPEEALERFPSTRLLRTGGNLGYGSAVNRAVAELTAAATTHLRVVIDDLIDLVLGRKLATRAPMPILPARLALGAILACSFWRCRTRPKTPTA